MSLLKPERWTLWICSLSLSSHRGLDFSKVNTTFSWWSNGGNREQFGTLKWKWEDVPLWYVGIVTYLLTPGTSDIPSHISIFWDHYSIPVGFITQGNWDIELVCLELVHIMFDFLLWKAGIIGHLYNFLLRVRWEMRWAEMDTTSFLCGQKMNLPKAAS